MINSRGVNFPSISVGSECRLTIGSSARHKNLISNKPRRSFYQRWFAFIFRACVRHEFTRVYLGEIFCEAAAAELFLSATMYCVIFYKCRCAHMRPCVIKIADCVRIADVFLLSRCCFSLLFTVLPARRKVYSCKFLRERLSRDEIGGTRSFYSAINFIPDANVT